MGNNKIKYDENNLVLLCNSCHNKLHVLTDIKKGGLLNK